MTEIALYEAKSKLSGLLDEVEAGRQFTITRRGKAVAKLTPVKQDFDRDKVQRAIDMFLEIREHDGAGLGDVSIKELIREGRR